MSYPFISHPAARYREADLLDLTHAQYEALMGFPMLPPCSHNSHNTRSTTITESSFPPYIRQRQGHCTLDDYEVLMQCNSISDCFPNPAYSRTQLIDGYLLAESTVSVSHQAIITELLYQIISQLKKMHSPFKVITSPVRLSFAAPTQSILLPDIALIKHPAPITDSIISERPVFVAEVLSPATCCLDTICKKKIYIHNQVREYWIINPATQNIRSYFFTANGTMQIEDFRFHKKVPVQSFEELYLDFTKLISL